jgi:hypothetical protein
VSPPSTYHDVTPNAHRSVVGPPLAGGLLGVGAVAAGRVGDDFIPHHIADVEFAAEALGVEQRAVHRDLALMLTGVLVRDGRAGRDAAHAADAPGALEIRRAGNDSSRAAGITQLFRGSARFRVIRIERQPAGRGTANLKTRLRVHSDLGAWLGAVTVRAPS